MLQDTNKSQRFINQYTQNYQTFKLTPDSQRTRYCQAVMKTPQDNDTLQYPNKAPNYYQKITVTGEDQQNIDLCVYIWEPENVQKADGILFMIHGINAYMGTLSYLADYIRKNNNLIVIGHDVRNFGRTTGVKRGYLQDLEEIMGDIDKVVKWGREKYGQGLPVSLAGFSMGGALTLKFANLRHHNYQWVILINPGIQSNPAGGFNLSLVDKMKISLFPHTYLFPCGFNKNVRHLPFIRQLQSDQYMYTGDIWAGTLGNVHKYGKKVKDSASEFDFPYLFVMSGNDKTINPFAVIDFDRNSPSKDKTHFFAPKMWHSVFFDKEITELVPEISKWIQYQIEKKK